MNGNSNSTCTTCNGAKMIQVGGTVQQCPVCDGSGKQYKPGLFFEYGQQFNLTPNQTLFQQAISILDAPFRWLFAVAQSTGAFTAQIFDGANKRPFMPTQLHNSIVFGTAQNPMPVIVPYVFQQRTSILVTLTDLSGANNAVWIGFIGAEVVDTQQTGQ